MRRFTLIGLLGLALIMVGWPSTVHVDARTVDGLMSGAGAQVLASTASPTRTLRPTNTPPPSITPRATRSVVASKTDRPTQTPLLSATPVPATKTATNTATRLASMIASVTQTSTRTVTQAATQTVAQTAVPSAVPSGITPLAPTENPITPTIVAQTAIPPLLAVTPTAAQTRVGDIQVGNIQIGDIIVLKDGTVWGIPVQGLCAIPLLVLTLLVVVARRRR